MGFGLWTTTAAAVAQQNGRSGAGTVEGDTQDLVFLADRRPVFVRLHIQVDGKGFRTLQESLFVTGLFESLDADGSGSLDRGEAAGLGERLVGVQSSSAPPDWKRLDADEDGAVSRGEFRDRLTKFLGPPLQIDLAPQRPTQSVGLFAMLDRDGDGRLATGEVAKGAATLRTRDIDANEVFGVDELLPPTVRLPGAARDTAAASRADLPFRKLGPDRDSLRRAAETLISRYGTKSAGDESPSVIARDVLGVDVETFSRTDADADGSLDAAELSTLLTELEPQARIIVRLSYQRFGFPKVSLLEGADGLVNLVRRESGRQAEFSIGGLDVSLSAGGRFVTSFDVVNFYGTQFLRADGDTNGYVDSDEFGGLGLSGARFESVDADGDGKLFRNELNAFLKQATEAAASNVTLAVAQAGRSLFELLDTNADFRLSRREFQEGPERLRRFDRDGDGSIAQGELSGRWKLSFRLAESPLLSSRDMIQAADDGPAPVVRETVAGPEWFRRMDQNRDGDLSQREFLGSPDLFDRIDGNRDGLIDAEEAETFKTSVD